MGTVKVVALIAGDPKVRGSLQFVQDPKGRITGLSPGLHGFHIHALGDTTKGCISTGNHGAPSDKEHHAGDLGNIVAGLDGVAEISIKDMLIPLSGQHSILGRVVVVHADSDDLGRAVGRYNIQRSSFMDQRDIKVDMILARQQETQVEELDVLIPFIFFILLLVSCAIWFSCAE